MTTAALYLLAAALLAAVVWWSVGAWLDHSLAVSIGGAR